MDLLHTWEKVELRLTAEREYENPYAEVTVWVDLEGPGFERRCYGFWDGEDRYVVRIAATASGEWRWTSGNSTGDPGLSGKSGIFTVIDWTEDEKRAVQSA